MHVYHSLHRKEHIGIGRANSDDVVGIMGY